MGDLYEDAAKWISEHIPISIGIGLFIFCLFFEVSKIKIYPLKWLWKLISWPFKKIDEQRTNSFKNIVVSFKSDIDDKLNGMTASFDAKLSDMATSQNASCATVKSCFTDLERRFDTLEDKLNDLEGKHDDTEEKLDQLAAARIKNHVLNFARQCRKNEPHSLEDFRNLVKENTLYQELVKKHNWTNDVYFHDYAYIMKVYDKCNEEGTFLE